MKKIIIGITALLLMSCASVSTIAPVGQNTYRVSSQMSGNFPSWPEVKGLSIKRANEYCKSNGKIMLEDKWETHGARGWSPLNAELTFKCIASSNEKEQSANKEVTPNKKSSDLYADLKELKKLLDSGAITKKEFEVLKSKRLSE